MLFLSTLHWRIKISADQSAKVYSFLVHMANAYAVHLCGYSTFDQIKYTILYPWPDILQLPSLLVYL